MDGVFDFFKDIGNYKDRVVANFQDKKGLSVDTSRVSDGSHPFETGVKHPRYYEGHWIIVQAYDTKEEAKAGHEVWVSLMTAKELPKVLKDCQNAKIAQRFPDELLVHALDGKRK